MIGDYPVEQLAEFERLGVGDHFERQRGDAIAIVGQLQVLEHCIGQAAIGRTLPGPFGSRDQRVGRLVAMSRVQPECPGGLEIAGFAAQQLAVCPDPPD